ncbi:hypothetical protein [Sedimentibacter sp. LTW-03]|uniref:hypothetical protein n=1 Tax=Sedimentibacter sp. LTW-03 TaxID=3453406 RepID=UPI003F852A24
MKIDSEHNKSVIYKGKNVEISSSPDGEHFIIIENPGNYIEPDDMDSKNVRNLKILDRQDNIVYDEIIKSNLQTELEPLGWNNSKFWATFNYAGGRPEFLVLDTEKLQYEVIENNADYFKSELNIRTGWICYSDFPQFRDIDAYNDFLESTKEVNLFLYNVFTNKKIKIATSIAKTFGPKWIDDYTSSIATRKIMKEYHIT